jgi:endonuclease YncB( thermonuclease family)
MARAKSNRFYLTLIPVLLLIPSVVLNIYLYANRNQANTVKVIGVIDGDTMVLEGKAKIRLRHVDAPELEYCGGKEAKKTLEDLVLGEKVRLEEQIPDQYGRNMALVYAGKTLVNQMLLSAGLVRYHHDKTSKTDLLKRLALAAKETRTGIFGQCQSTEPENPKCVIKGNIDKQNDAHKYYLPDCAQYKFTVVEKDVGEAWFCGEKEAEKAGFVKAETCR